MTARRYLTVGDVPALHRMSVEAHGGTPGLRDLRLLESAVMRPQSGYDSDIISEAASLGESIGRNHPFMDGNKRASFAAVDVFLRINGYGLDVTPDAAIEWLLERFETRTFTKRELEDWLRRVVVSAWFILVSGVLHSQGSISSSPTFDRGYACTGRVCCPHTWPRLARRHDRRSQDDAPPIPINPLIGGPALIIGPRASLPAWAG